MKNSLNQNLDKQNSSVLNWELIQEDFKIKFGKDVFESWLKKMELIETHLDYLLILVPTRFIRDWITSRYLDSVIQIVKSHNKNINRIEFKINSIVTSTLNKKSKFNENNQNNEIEHNVSFIKDSFIQYNRIDPNKNFDNFVIGQSNSLAFEASKKVTDNISSYNPLYLYSGVGMGKTHLLNAIGLKLKTNKKVMFISAERFMYHFVKSIKSNEMLKFKDYFRNTDVLLIDDIQFMNGKEALQEEFFHTFCALLEKGSQIVLSADRPPSKLSRIQERIRSRFSGGLVVDIQNPDLNLRSEIIKKKLSDLSMVKENNFIISEEIQKFICSEIKSSVREIIGALNRIVSFARIYNRVPNLSETRIILKDLLNIYENKVSIDSIQTIVCKYFKI